MLRRIVEASLRHPTLRELEAMLRDPLGDPGAAARVLELRRLGRRRRRPVAPSPDRVLTTVEREGRPAVAVLHDPQLAEDPELVHAAGAMALLAQENAELEAGWNDALRELSGSRARIAEAAAVERRALERDLHDGAQQQLTAVLMKLSLVRELVPDASVAHARIVELECRPGADAGGAPAARPRDLSRAARRVAASSARSKPSRGAPAAAIEVSGDGVGRYPAGARVRRVLLLPGGGAERDQARRPGRARLDPAAGDRAGCCASRSATTARASTPSRAHDGMGLRNLRDRLDAFDGRLEIVSAPGRGTVIAGVLPVA